MQDPRTKLRRVERTLVTKAGDAAQRVERFTPRSRVLVRLLVILALIPLALWGPPVITAILLVSIVLLGWAPAFTDLLLAFRPLLLPALLVAVLGALDLPAWQQLLIGALAAAVLLPWAASDWARFAAVVMNVVDTTLRAAHWLVGILVAVALVLVALLVFGPPDAAGGAVETFDEFGGPALTGAALGVVAWCGALVLRVLGYGRSLGRAAVAVLLLIGLVQLVAEQDLLGDPRIFSWLDASVWLGLAGAVLVLVIAAESRDVTWATRPWMSRRAHDRLFSAGLGGALASTVVLALALTYSWAEVTGAPEPIAGARPEPPAKPLAQMSDAEVIEAFMPVLSFSDEQRWLPQEADEYARQATLKPQPAADATVVRYLPEGCPEDRAEPCYALHCETRFDVCAGTDDGLARRRGRHDDGYAYVRLTPANDPVPPFGARVERLVQYWYFYPYDEWRAPILGGRLVQRHAGDWENVTVGLGRDEPLFVAFSQHCGGRWERWKDVVVAREPRPRTHPLVGVAVGSHANYQRAGAKQPPDWSTCLGLPGESVALLTHTWNIRDRTGTDWELLPSRWERVTAATWPMRYRGTWGHEDVTEFKGLATRVLGRGRGPRTPTRQALWTHPMRRIFCEAPWKGPRPRTC